MFYLRRKYQVAIVSQNEKHLIIFEVTKYKVSFCIKLKIIF